VPLRKGYILTDIPLCTLTQRRAMDTPPIAPREPDIVGRNLQYARLRAHLSLTELSRRAQVHISTLSNVEHGRRRGEDLRGGQLRRLADVLEVSLDWLTGRWIDPSIPAPPDQEVWKLTGPERENLIMQLVAQREALRGLPAEPPPDARSIRDAVDP
jgi:transcriptional regulator with XRE-family HTH domain